MLEFPLDWAAPRVRDLHAALAAAIYRASDIERALQTAGLSPADVPWDRTPRQIWHAALDHAASQLRADALVDAAAAQQPALAIRVAELRAASPVVRPTAPGPAPEWKGFGNERQIVEGEETLLDIAFLERGLRKAAAVCRLTVAVPARTFQGTAFRVGAEFLLTNHHVLHDCDNGGAAALSVEAAFGYELDLEGRLRRSTDVACDVSTIVSDAEHDFAVIRAAEPLPDVPVLPLSAGGAVEVGDRVMIVQHPEGLPKKIALAHNLVRHVDDDIVQYWTDTHAGSSGSPVFNEDWEVVALHQQWVEAPPEDGASYRNQGRNIRRVAERLGNLNVGGIG